MKVLILTHFYWPESFAAANRVTAFAEHLASKGHAVTVATGFPNYPTNALFPGYRNRLFSHECRKGVRILRSLTYVPSSSGTLSRLLNYVVVSAITFLRLLVRPPEVDVMVFSSPPLLWAGCAIGLSLLYRWPLVADIRDLWPEIGVLLGGIRPGSPTHKVFGVAADRLYRRSRAITVTNPAKRGLISRDYGVPAKRISVVWNGVDACLLERKGGRGTTPDGWGGDSSFRVLFAGLIGVAQGVDQIIHAAGELRSKNGVHFLLLGDGAEKEKMVTLADQLKLASVSFHESVPRDRLPSYYAAAHACIVPLKSKALQDSVPSKLFEAMALGCPVVLCADEHSDAAQLVRGAGGGLVVAPGDAAALAEALERLRSDATLRESMAEGGRRYVLANYTREAMCSRLEAVLESAVPHVVEAQGI